MRTLPLICLLALIAGCAGGEGPPPREEGTRLVIELWPRGDDGPVKRRVVTDVPAGINSGDFEPVPRGVACAEVYGGPAKTRVEGTLDGERIDATFSRTNACEMARWERVESLLGRAQRAGG